MFIGYIYKITGSCGKVYIGSTINYKNRVEQHNSRSLRSCSSRELKKPLEFKIIRKDEYKLTRTMHLVEQYYIDNIDCVNKLRAYTKLDKKKYQKNYRETHKEQARAYHKAYRETHKEELRKYKAIKVECNYCKKLVCKDHKLRHQRTRKCLAIQESLKDAKY